MPPLYLIYLVASSIYKTNVRNQTTCYYSWAMNNRFLALVMVLALGAASAQSERFQLFANCKPIDLFVEELPGTDAARIGLSKQRVQTAVESRLRSAQLYGSSRFAPFLYFKLLIPLLYVKVNVVGAAHSVDFEFHQEVRTLDSGLIGFAATWDHGFTGIHGGDASYIMSGISELMDIFLSEYLRVNEGAC